LALTTNQIALFIAMLFASALVLQYPISWLSDRIGAYSSLIVFARAAACPINGRITGGLWPLMAAAFLREVAPPLYAPLLAFTNDALQLQICPLHLGACFYVWAGCDYGSLVGRLAMQKTAHTVGAWHNFCHGAYASIVTQRAVLLRAKLIAI
jgi:hypothetical protein